MEKHKARLLALMGGTPESRLNFVEEHDLETKAAGANFGWCNLLAVYHFVEKLRVQEKEYTRLFINALRCLVI